MLDRYQLRRELHTGAAGELWLARERDTHELVVARLGIGPVRSERAQREGRVLSRLSHPAIPRFIDQGPVDGGWCVVAEHVDGARLSKVLRVTSPSPPRAVGWSRQIALGLARLHAAGVVHGDLHPANVILARDDAGRDRMVLVGFGVATIDGEPPGVRPGGAHTVAPEVVRGELPTPGADVYTLGAILYRMLVERWPFAGSEQDVLEAQVGTPPPPLGRHVPALRLPPGLEALVFRCLEKSPADRYASADALVEDLAALAFLPQRDWVRVDGSDGSQETPVTQVPAGPRISTPRSDGGGEPLWGMDERWMWAGAAAFGTGGAATLAWLLWWLAQ